LRLTGEHVVADYVLALGAALAAGANFDAAVAALEALEPAHMRQEVTVTPGGITVIDDSYNASPASLAAALAVLAARACKGRRIAVLGEVGELGSEAPRLHAAMGGYVAAQPLDLIIFVGGPTSHVHEMAQAARSMGFSADCLEEVETCEAAARVLCEVVAPGDVVLAKGSRSVGLDAVVKEVLAHVE
jgi:UDP-N-acetylmuramoyl-tripeptide--D-alanyl-D-alanine ligase